MSENPLAHKPSRGIMPPKERNIIVFYGGDDKMPVRIDLREAVVDAAVKADGDAVRFSEYLENTYHIRPCLSLDDDGRVVSISYETRNKLVDGKSIKWHNSGQDFGIEAVTGILNLKFGQVWESDELWKYVRDPQELGNSIKAKRATLSPIMSDLDEVEKQRVMTFGIGVDPADPDVPTRRQVNYCERLHEVTGIELPARYDEDMGVCIGYIMKAKPYMQEIQDREAASFPPSYSDDVTLSVDKKGNPSLYISNKVASETFGYEGGDPMAMEISGNLFDGFSVRVAPEGINTGPRGGPKLSKMSSTHRRIPSITIMRVPLEKANFAKQAVPFTIVNGVLKVAPILADDASHGFGRSGINVSDDVVPEEKVVVPGFEGDAPSTEGNAETTVEKDLSPPVVKAAEEVTVSAVPAVDEIPAVRSKATPESIKAMIQDFVSDGETTIRIARDDGTFVEITKETGFKILWRGKWESV